MSEIKQIVVKGAREHNLKNIHLNLPKSKLIVFTGVSGSGKSSLAFDTLYAEGQRRYVESLSAYARQFLGLLEKPKFDTIRGLSPTIAIEQKSASKNPRSTVGTITEIYDYLRVLYARIGVQKCISCHKEVGKSNPDVITKQILKLGIGQKIILLSPLIENRKGEHKELLQGLKSQGIIRVRINGQIQEIPEKPLPKTKKHTVDAIIDRLVIKSGTTFKKRLTDSIETALKLGKGRMIVHTVCDQSDLMMNENRSCCDRAYRELEPSHFSFNSPQGMCHSCQGLGSILRVDPDKVVPNKSLSIRQGAVLPWKSFFEKEESTSWGRQRIAAMEKQWKLNIDTPWNKLSTKLRKNILYGPKSEKEQNLKIHWNSKKGSGSWETVEEGLVNRLMKRYQLTQSEASKTKYSKFLSRLDCDHCKGNRLQDDLLNVFVHNISIMDLCSLTIKDAYDSLVNIKWNKQELLIAGELIKEITSRLKFLLNVGLNYLSLDRYGPSLSGGEAQRIRLASQIGSELTGVLYILDEPSIGLHQSDNSKLIDTLIHLKTIGNTLIVVEHDRETIDRADWVIDFGPGAGHLGGNIVAQGTPKQLYRNKNSLTGKYLSGKRLVSQNVKHQACRSPKGALEIYGASEHNLKSIDVKIPLGLFTCITGVSGAGKSTLVREIIYPILANKLSGAQLKVGKYSRVKGIELIDKVVNITQQPIGRTPRSNPATYVKLLEPIRDLFAGLPESRLRGYTKGRFSFNVKEGRCETCSGDGHVKVEMHFLADVFVPCEECHGKRFNEQTLEVKYKGHSISDVLNLTVSQAKELFLNHEQIGRVLDTLCAVGLEYIQLGQSATSLSGGEAQRIKLAKELAKRDSGNTFYILDEPTTGLHFEDIRKLLEVLQQLVSKGNTVLLIEHNLEVITTVDWVIDLGPEGGDRGGKIVAQGTPEKIATSKQSITGQYLMDLV